MPIDDHVEPVAAITTQAPQAGPELFVRALRLMDKILHDPKDPKLWELWYIPYYGSCRILSISRIPELRHIP